MTPLVALFAFLIGAIMGEVLTLLIVAEMLRRVYQQLDEEQRAEFWAYLPPEMRAITAIVVRRRAAR